ncbi:hypothetical protein ALC57_18360, partial [Trachymyrmex cornetzi]
FKDWLTSHPDNGKAFCTACKTVLVCGMSKLRKHANRKHHILNLKKEKDLANPFVPLLTKEIVSKDHKKDVKIAEIKLSALYAEHNITLRTLDHMVPLIKEIFSCFTLSRRKYTQIIKNVIEKRESETIIEFLRKQKFSILLDESTTISNDKVLSDKVYNAFKNCLQSKRIPLQNIIGLACDNASVMVGIHDSFVTRLKNEVPALILLKCICHSSALIATCSKLPESCERVSHLIATYISNSPKRSAILCEYQTFFGVESRKILKLSCTRWLVLQKCVTRVLENWEVFIHYFYLEVFETKNKSAQEILSLLENDHIKAYMLFLKHILFDENSTMLGNKKFDVDTDDTIIIDEERYKGTPDLYELFFKKIPNDAIYTENDKQTYKHILLTTNAHRRDNNARMPIKNNKGHKYKNIIAPLLVTRSVSGTSIGSGIKTNIPSAVRLTDNEIDYVHWDDPNELVDRLQLLDASRRAGNNAHDNEILSIIEELRETGLIIN